MTLPPNFSQAVDLSSLGKPPADTSTPMPGLEITPQNLQTEVLPLSEGKPVVILCWSPRSADSVTMLRALGKIESEDKSKWVLAHVNVEEQAPVAQALAPAVRVNGIGPGPTLPSIHQTPEEFAAEDEMSG